MIIFSASWSKQLGRDQQVTLRFILLVSRCTMSVYRCGEIRTEPGFPEIYIIGGQRKSKDFPLQAWVLFEHFETMPITTVQTHAQCLANLPQVMGA